MKVEAKGIVKAIKQGNIVTFLEVHGCESDYAGYEYNVYNSNYMKERTGKIYNAINLDDAFDIACDDHLSIRIDFISDINIDYDRFIKYVKSMEDSIKKLASKINLLLNLTSLSQEGTEEEINERLMKQLVERYDNNWRLMAEKEELPSSFIIQYWDKINWDIISRKQDLSDDILKKLPDKVDWKLVSRYHNLTDDFLTRYADKLSWKIISSRPLTEEDICKYRYRVDWSVISRTQKLSENFICKFKEYIDVYGIIRYQSLSEDFIRSNLDMLYPHITPLFRFQKMTEDFMMEILDTSGITDKTKIKYVLTCICEVHNVSERFIRKYVNYMDWKCISASKNISDDFIREFQDNIDWKILSRYGKLSERLIREFKDKVYWWYIYEYQELSKEFKNEFKDRVSFGTYISSINGYRW